MSTNLFRGIATEKDSGDGGNLSFFHKPETQIVAYYKL